MNSQTQTDKATTSISQPRPNETLEGYAMRVQHTLGQWEAEHAALLAVAEAAKLIQFQRAHNNPNMTTVHKSDRDALKQALAALAAVQGGAK